MPTPNLLSRAECSVLRGIAILGIVLHNYCHWLGFAVKENEYKFFLSRSEGLLSALLNPDLMLPIHLLSYFGHYGVPLFLFLSGYGLVLKYEGVGDQRRSRGRSPLHGSGAAFSFIGHHFVKLFGIMLPGFVLFVLIDAITPNPWHYEAPNVVAQLLMVVNLLPSPDHAIWPGPFWFFGLMLQLYIVYRLLLFRRSWKVALGLVIVCWGLQAACSPEGETLNRLRYNCVGGMMPLVSGVLVARYWGRWASGRRLAIVFRIIALLALLALGLLMCFSFQAWLWVPLVVIACSILLVKVLPRPLASWLDKVGIISASMFVCHPILRKILIPISRSGDVYCGLLLYVLSVVVVSILWHRLRKSF